MSTDEIITQRNLLKGTLDEYGKAFTDLINIQPKQLDIKQVATMITSTPVRKWNAAQAVVDTTIGKKACEQELKKTRAKFMLQARHNKDLSAAPDREAFVINQPEVEKAEIALINADAQLTAAKLAYECLEDLFTAGKKVMDYLLEQDRAEKQYNKYTNGGARNQ